MKTAAAIIMLFVGSFLAIGYGSYFVMNGIEGEMGPQQTKQRTYGRQPKRAKKKSGSMRDQSLFTWKRGKARRD